MRKALLFGLVLLTAGCGGGGNQGRQDPQGSQRMASAESAASEDKRSAGPEVKVSAAPGVAFNYSYSFRLASERIAQVQEEHARACEKLGVARCRITGMHYKLVGARDVEAQLAFKVEPALARQFGKQGIDAVTHADGMLVESEITGEDVGSKISASKKSEGTLADQLRKIEAQLARPGLGSRERAELQEQAQQLRQQIEASRADRGENEEALASTPLVFNYGSGDLVAGYDQPFHRAWRSSLDNVVSGSAIIFTILVTLLPWLLMIGLLYWLWRRFVRPRLRPAGAEEVSPTLPAA